MMSPLQPRAAPKGGLAPHLLVIEDDPACQELVSVILETDGYRVTRCDDGRAALALIEAGGHTFDMVLVDVGLPGMDGLEVIRRLRARLSMRDVPVLCMSARVSLQDEQQALQAGCDAFLPKPFMRQALLQAVNRQWMRETDTSAELGTPG